MYEGEVKPWKAIDDPRNSEFQKIIVNSTSIKQSIDILYGLKEKYEQHHRVKFTNNAIEECVLLSERYIPEKFLPDKAIDIMDEAGARAHMFNLKVPDNILKVEIQIQKIREEKENKVLLQLFEQAAILRDNEKKLLDKLSKAQKRWQKKEDNNLLYTYYSTFL